MLPSATQILAACPLLTLVRDSSRTRLEAMAQVLTFAPEETIFHQGEPCPGIFIVGRGLVRIYKLAPSGKEHVLHVVEAGGVFAEMAVIGDFALPAFAQALEPTTCVLLPAGAFRRALKDDHELCLQLLGGMALWVKHLIGLVESITLRDALGRVAHHLLGLEADAQGIVHLPALKRHLASHLNLTSETLSRVLRRLKEDGAITEEGENLRIVERMALEKLAEGDLPSEEG